MGVVYKARDPLLDRIVAVKTIMSPQGQGRRVRSAFLERFQREAKAAAKMQHPAIVTIFDVGVDEESRRAVHGARVPAGRVARRSPRSRADPARALRVRSRSISRRRCRSRTASASSTATSSRRTCSTPATTAGSSPISASRACPTRDLTQVGIFMGTPGLLAARGDPRRSLHPAGRRVRVGRGASTSCCAGGSRTRAPTPRRPTATSCRATRRRRRATIPRSPSRSRRSTMTALQPSDGQPVQGRLRGRAGAARGVGSLPDRRASCTPRCSRWRRLAHDKAPARMHEARPHDPAADPARRGLGRADRDRRQVRRSWSRASRAGSATTIRRCSTCATSDPRRPM